MSQLGEVLAVGDVTQKIEGFFALCSQRGLTGSQGVIVPRANVQHLMLRPAIVEAARAGRFAVHAVERIDEAVTLLTGRAAGARGADGQYPRGTANAAVEDALARWAPIGAAVPP